MDEFTYAPYDSADINRKLPANKLLTPLIYELGVIALKCVNM